ncbi:MAG TPA: tRNA modification GTPase [Fibrobacteria bacterium]|nr:tRNA modification GTPase [Fibrobacteria bacterium]HOX51273.1 tRNA modification GTPase [Fibrobacteria bacterium]
MSTICAPTTAPGRSAISVVRVSGPEVERILGRRKILLQPRRATLVAWPSRDGRVLDQALAVYFKGPASYTGEDVLELSLHGNPLLVREVLEDLHEDGIRLAGPGEFTRRAVEAGRIPLSRAESVGELIHAETSQSLEAARRVLGGGLESRLAPVRSSLVDLSARLELEVDFAEEDAVPGGQELVPWVDAAVAELDGLLASQERIRSRGHAPRVVLAGSPNAGKSSLANALLGEDRLLVSPVAGTTRDWIEIPLPTLRGTVVLVDTAGLGDPTDELDHLAQERTRRILDHADLRLVVVPSGRELSSGERHLAEGGPSLLVRTKTDLHPDWGVPSGQWGVHVGDRSALEALVVRLSELLDASKLPPGEIALVGERQRQAALQARGELISCREGILEGRPEIAAWHARRSRIALEELLGDITADEVLGAVFSSFCIGK